MTREISVCESPPPSPSRSSLMMKEPTIHTPNSLTEQENNTDPSNRTSQKELLNNKLTTIATEPRKRQPLQVRDLNRQETPQLLFGHNSIAAEKKSLSAPSLTSKQVLLPIKSIENEQTKRNKRPLIDNDEEGVKLHSRNAKKASVSINWKYSDDSEGVERILQDLQLDVILNDQVVGPIELFTFLQNSGQLCQRTLKLFATCPKVASLMMGPSYGKKMSDLGLLGQGRGEYLGCTKSLFKGFADLVVLDLTFVPIGDDDIRYVIKLKKLQALGLSGTMITDKGLKYLARHAEFASTLKCLKLCYMEQLDDSGLVEVSRFTGLTELDLFGSTKISLNGVLHLHELILGKIRLPEKIFSELRDRRILMSQQMSLAQRSGPLCIVNSLNQLSLLSDEEIKIQLRCYQKTYPDIFLNLDICSLKQKLAEIVKKRQLEERLWSICQ